MTQSRALLRTLATALLCCAVGAGCASSKSSRVDRGENQERTITTVRDVPIRRAAPGPIVSGEAVGVEVHWWIADNARAEIPRALEPYIDDPEPITAHLRARWDAAGLRIVRVPLEDLPIIERAATPLSDLNRTWHHAAGIWVEFFRGRQVDPATNSFRINRRTYSGPPGLLRFLGRTSIVPTPQRTAAVRIELAAQVHASRSSTDDVFALPRAITPIEQGRVFDQLTLRADLLPGFAYIITAEKPGVLWREPEPTEPDTDPRDLNPDPPAPSPSASFGPAARAIPTLGEAMFSATRAETGTSPGRVLLVLVPRAPETYSLLR